MLATMALVAPGNGLVDPRRERSGAKAPAPKRLADAVAAAGGIVRQFKSPQGRRARGLDRGRGPRARADARARAPPRRWPSGSAATSARPTPSAATRPGSPRWSSTSSPSTAATAPIAPDDVRALVAEAVPGSVWAFTDAVGERRVERALEALDRLLETTPEPVLLAVLHRRVRELIETGDRLAAGERLPRSARRWASTASSGWKSCATRRRPGRRTN